MKTRSFFHASAVLALWVFSACNTGNVRVSGAGSLSPGSLKQKPTAPTPGASDDSQQIFFERVMTTGSEIQEISAISYASSAAVSSTPFGNDALGFPLKTPRDFSPYRVFAVNSAASSLVTYLRPSGRLRDSLVSISSDLNSTTRSFFEFPTSVATFSLSPAGESVVWIDDFGQVSVSELASSIKTATLDTDSSKALDVVWAKGGKSIVIRTDSGEALIYLVDAPSATWKLSRKISHLVAASVSPGGNQLAYVTDRADLKIADIGAELRIEDRKIGLLQSDEIHDFSWAGSKFFSYWVQLNSGEKEIRVADYTGSETTVAFLGVPDSVGENVVCPVWMSGSGGRGEFFYSDYVAGRYVIEKGTFDASIPSGLAKVSLFVAPPASDEGFVCPGLSSNGGAL